MVMVMQVWDIRKHRCLQTMVYADNSIKQKFKLSSIKYDQHRQRIITGSILPRVRPMFTSVLQSVCDDCLQAASNAEIWAIVVLSLLGN